MILVHADPVRDLPDGPGWAEALRQARTRDRDLELRRRLDRGRRHRPAGRGPRREGGHGHPPRRPPAAAAARRPAPRRRAPDLAGAGRALGATRRRDRDRLRRPRRSRRSPPRSRSTPASAPRRSAAAGCAGRSARRRAAFRTAGPAATGGRRAGETPATDGGGLRLGTYRDLWADEVTERNPALRFLAPAQTVELAPSDGERLGLADGDEVERALERDRVRARVALRERMRPGAAFLIEGTARGQRQRARRARGRDTEIGRPNRKGAAGKSS